MSAGNIKNIYAYLRKQKIDRRHILYGLVIILLLLLSSVSLYRLSPYKTSEGERQYYRAKVVQVYSANPADLGLILRVKAKLLDGPQTNKVIEVPWSSDFKDEAYRRLPTGSQILLFKDPVTTAYGVVGRWYMPGIATLFLMLLVLVIMIGAWRGITSILGLAISIFILATYVIPQIMAGRDAFIVCIEAAVLITFVSIYIAHGVSRRTTIALFGSVMSLFVVIVLTRLASYLTGASAVIDENNAAILRAAHPINLDGLLTGGIVIASLGPLFDITTGQAATVDEIHKTDSNLAGRQLFVKGISVGREHIAALINTLALVYAGVALPVIITTAVRAQTITAYAGMPLIVRLNTETITEEIMRTCVASIGVLLALPITTWLAAYVLPRWTQAGVKK